MASDPVIVLDETGPGAETAIYTLPPDLEVQGIYLHGRFADAAVYHDEFLSAGLPSVPNVARIRAENMVLKLETASGTVIPFNVPLELPSSINTGGAKLRIDDVNLGTTAGGGFEGYKLSYYDPGTKQWLPYCDASESEWAVPMNGYWTSERVHERRSNAVTFSCRSQGKAAACGSWGYWPEDDLGAGPGDPTNFPLWELHQACIQMAMALYCGPGDTPHTREKTPIVIRDWHWPGAKPNYEIYPLRKTPPSYPPAPPPPDVFFYESAYRAREVVLCLNHMRWADLPVGDLCDGALRDPRVHRDATYCEEEHHDLNNLTLLVASKTMDLALHQWGSNTTGDLTTTAHGFLGGNEAFPRTRTYPPAGFDAPVLADEGYILRNLTGELLDDLANGDLVRAYRMTSGSDTVLGYPGMPGLPKGYTYTDPEDFEGYLFLRPSPHAQTQPMYLYTSLFGTDYVTANKPPAGLWTKVQQAPIGHVIKAPL